MKPEEYIQSKLAELKPHNNFAKYTNKTELKAEIFRLLMSKKYRKYSVTPECAAHIQRAVEICVDRNEPIKLTESFGGYKLWRLPESPEVDWAEFFTLTYYTRWLRPICEIHKPGIWFDFFVDDVILARLNNIDPSESDQYRESFRRLLSYFKKFIPDNLNFTYNRVIDRYKDQEEFEKDFTDKFSEIQKNGMPELDEKTKRTIELNVKLTPDQANDPYWREKVDLIHSAYLKVSKKRPYYLVEDKILVVTNKIGIRSLAVGTTKHSIAKFWCGIGVLQKDGDDYHQLVLTPSQIEKNKLAEEKINITGLDGKNFHQIKILR